MPVIASKMAMCRFIYRTIFGLVDKIHDNSVNNGVIYIRQWVLSYALL